MTEYCKGCASNIVCLYRKLNKGDCPCTNCLVKVTCSDLNDFNECDLFQGAIEKMSAKIEESREKKKNESKV